jgi:hypothetical protein
MLKPNRLSERVERKQIETKRLFIIVNDGIDAPYRSFHAPERAIIGDVYSFANSQDMVTHGKEALPSIVVSALE